MRKRVLVADDDSSIRESLRKLLEETGYEVVLAADGEDALKQLEAEAADLLVLDLEMPKRDGWDVLEEMINRRSLMPIIVITGRANELDTRLISGPGALLEKPVEADILLKRVEELVAESAEKRTENLERSRTVKEAPGYLAISEEISGRPIWPKR